MTRSRDVANIDTLLTTKGDIYAASAAYTPTRLAVGSNNQVLTADSSTATGLKWDTPSGYTQIASGNFPTNAATFDISTISQSYRDLVIYLKDFYATADTNITIRFEGDTGSNYQNLVIVSTSSTAGTVAFFNSTYIYVTDGDVDNTADDNFVIITIRDYASSNSFKIVQTSGVYKDNTAGFRNIINSTASWLNTSAVDQVTVMNTTASNFSAGSYVVYGVK